MIKKVTSNKQKEGSGFRRRGRVERERERERVQVSPAKQVFRDTQLFLLQSIKRYTLLLPSFFPSLSSFSLSFSFSLDPSNFLFRLTTMPSRRRTLLKVIILGDSGCVYLFDFFVCGSF